MTTLKPFDIISRNSRNTDVLPKLGYGLFWLALFVASLGAGKNAYAQADPSFCDSRQTITANVVVLDNPTVFNRLGAQNPNWITYALERDVVDRTTKTPCSETTCTAGNVELRPDKRPRPLVVRSVAGSCLTVNFTNLLAPVANPNNAQQDNLFNDDQVAGRCAGFHASGTELVTGMKDDGSMVGANDTGGNAGPTNAGQSNCGEGMAAPGEFRTYQLYTPHEGAFLVNSYGATIGSESSSGNLGIGMFGALNVQPVGAKMYRSQVTEEELRLATTGLTPSGHPIINYEAVYPNDQPWIAEGKAGLPILNMLTAGGELVHSDINAIIAGSEPDGSFAPSTYPLESKGFTNPQLPNRLEPFREFTSIFHDEQTNSQVFPRWYADPVLKYTLAGVKDQFMINYGSGGIGSEIIANRLHTGPMHDCTDCAYEEFFLASQTVGDPGGLVNFPANTGIEQCDPSNILDASCWRQFNDPVHGAVGANPPIPGNHALFQEDPSNVHHSYTGDFVKIRNTHAGAFEQHIFHLHNHQWLFNPNDDNSNYLDAQEIMPGSGHTYELVNGGVGNRNKTAGDAIFHCHFYPHFAQGMWYHIRIQDTFERGTVLAVSGADPQNPALFDPADPAANFHTAEFALRNGKPAAGARALPDGELPDGWPIPAIVPLPGKAMPPMPAEVSVAAVDRGDFGVLSGRRPPNGLGQGPDSSQAIVNFDSVAGEDGILGTADDVTPGFPFWLAGNSCGVPTDDDPCPEGTVGQRQPTPVLDMLTVAGATANDYPEGAAGGWDGGLPRHNLRGYTSGGLSLDTQNRLDFRKIVKAAQPVYYPETGTVLEKVSMAHHADREHPSYANNLSGAATEATWETNGSKAVPGAPFQDPCVDDLGQYLDGATEKGEHWFAGYKDGNKYNVGGNSPYTGDNPRTYKVANVQIDAVFNKVGHHYSQERIIALWEDVAPTINKQRPPEPLVMRFNSYDCGKILHSNLVPAEFEVDDFQVRTPTDIIGQHIHLPKWDLTTNDGAANGWNYEDGTLSPLMVQERIEAINNFNALAGTNQNLVDILTALGVAPDLNPLLVAAVANHQVDLSDLAPVVTIDTGDPEGTPAGLGCDPITNSRCPATAAGLLEPRAHPFFGVGNEVNGHHEYAGARTTIQRILVDPVLNVEGEDRGLGLTFSHDHYGPSTFQQIGLYSTILAEPRGSSWVHNESGQQIGWLPDGSQGAGRDDGGPTTWQAAILTDKSKTPYVENHREFYFEMSDFQHAYNAGTYVAAGPDGRPLTAEAGVKIKQIHEVVQPDPFDATVAFAPTLQDTWQQVINPSLKLEAAGGFPDVVTANGGCPGPLGNNDPNVPRPCAEAINIAHGSTWVVNYRNEPVGQRVFDPNAVGPDGQNGAQAAGKAGDLAFALQSRTDRAQPALNTSFGNTPYPAGSGAGAINGGSPEYCSDKEFGDGINCDRMPGDPFTPIMRAFENDQVKVKIQVGATEEQHQATIHGFKWLSNGSGFGRSPNSGWRNFQSTGISEQFSLQVPVTRDVDQRGNFVDYLYANDSTRPGIWLGTWGVLRAYNGQQALKDLYELPNNPFIRGEIQNADQFVGVCPADPNADTGGKKKGGKGGNDNNGNNRDVPLNLKAYDVTVVLANDVLPNVLDATIPPNIGGDSDGDGVGDNAGGPLNPDGGTLVYNRRQTNVPDVVIQEPGLPGQRFAGGDGPLHDPTAILYVRTEDLVFDTACEGADGGLACRTELGDPVGLQPGAPVEPLVLRANAGDCIEVTLRNALPFTVSDVIDPDTGAVIGQERVPSPMPDLAGWQDMMWGVTRRVQGAGVNAEMYFFNNNLVRPSSYVGLHPQLVEYDISRDDGMAVGQNDTDGRQIVPPGDRHVYRWYAGHRTATKGEITGRRNQQRQQWILDSTPIEFGASNLLAADRIKQPQKGLFGALSILPEGTTAVVEATMVPDGQGSAGTRLTRAQVDVMSPAGPAGSGGNFREALAIGHKIANIRWADGRAIRNIHQNELGREGAEDSGHAGFNYGMEPSWFRFQLPPDVPFGNAGAPGSFGSIPNPQAMYSNALVGGEDPVTPVFRAKAGDATRMYVLNGASADRDGTFILHGHVWQRDPYVCLDEIGYLGLEGLCYPGEAAPSRALGLNPIGKYMGGQEGMGHAYGYWPILFNAGGTNAVKGDYLYRDYSPSGNRNGQFGILRVE